MLMNVNDIKSYIRLTTGLSENKQTIELYNFQTLEHTWIEDRNYIRICCDGRYYTYPTSETCISKIIIY